ncbi:MAG: hypothetical protein LBJ67_13185 [Planctomycetaceae bacterium]|nr:hypothetical protein [Planctomycetaceae bacterium]
MIFFFLLFAVVGSGIEWVWSRSRCVGSFDCFLDERESTIFDVLERRPAAQKVIGDIQHVI